MMSKKLNSPHTYKISNEEGIYNNLLQLLLTANVHLHAYTRHMDPL
jgi:hypothetical protein